ncbi:MAG: hypothetical protein ACLGHN_00410 [Bacteriovoracia bacterium]
MANRIESGKSRLVKGSLLYLWEELKTLNRTKFRALARIISGYFRMKLDQRKLISRRKSHGVNDR